MDNPFEESYCEPSVVDFDSSLPICFGDTQNSHPNASQTSPIALVDLDRLSEKLSGVETAEPELRTNLKQLQLLLR